MAIRTFFNYNNIEIPKKRLKTIAVNNVREDKFVTYDEVKKLVRASNNLRDKVIIRTLYHGGMRSEELINLNVGDLVLNEYKINVKGVKGSHRVRRVRLVIPKDIIPTITGYLQQRGINPDSITESQKKEPLLISKKTGDRIGYQTIKLVIKALGPSINKSDLTPHWLRHGHVVWCKISGIPAESTARNIGDRVETTMKIYSHFTEDDRDRDFDLAEGKGEEKIIFKDTLEELEEQQIINKTLEETVSKLAAQQEIILKVLEEKGLI
jgi:integrase